MSLINNPMWIGLDGTPVTGRVPPRVFVMEGSLTLARLAQVQHAYHLFCLGKATAVGDYFVASRTLVDGTRVRCESMQDQDHVLVWCSDSEREDLANGFQFLWRMRGRAPTDTDGKYLWAGCMTRPLPPRYTGFRKSNYPGFFTWSSKSLKLAGRPVQISWGESRDDFYELVPAADIYVGWNKVKRYSEGGAARAALVLCACMHQDEGGLVTLRTVETSDPNKFEFVEYGARSSGEPFENLDALARALSATVLKRTPWPEAAVEPPTPDVYWRFQSRPSFNKSGSSVAFVVQLYDLDSSWQGVPSGYYGSAIMTVGVESASMQRHFPAYSNGATSVTATTTIEDYFVSTSSAADTVVTRHDILAADYLGDELVWAWKHLEKTGTLTSVDSYSYTTGVQEVEFMRSIQYTVSAGHSKYGELLTFRHSMSLNCSGSYPAESASAIRTGGAKHLDVAFGGDLGRDGFCLGWCDEELVPAPSLSAPEFDDYYVSFSGMDTLVSKARIKYDAYLGGRKVASGIEGPRVFENISPPYSPPAHEFRVVGDDFIAISAGRQYFSRQALTNAIEGSEHASYSSSRRLGADIAAEMMYGGWAVHRTLLVDETVGNLDANGFYYTGYGNHAQCTVSPDGDAMYIADVTYGTSEHPGLCHFIRKENDSYRILWMAYKGLNGSEPYLLAPRSGIFTSGPSEEAPAP